MKHSTYCYRQYTKCNPALYYMNKELHYLHLTNTLTNENSSTAAMPESLNNIEEPNMIVFAVMLISVIYSVNYVVIGSERILLLSGSPRWPYDVFLINWFYVDDWLLIKNLRKQKEKKAVKEQRRLMYGNEMHLCSIASFYCCT